MNKALFLDRDGIVNVDHGYTYKKEDFEFVPGIFDLCQRATALGYIIIIVTNQSGIARGYYSEDDFLQLTDWMTERFALNGINIAGVYFCPHHPDQGTNEFAIQCNCRKPAPGMLLNAADEHRVDLSQSVMVGDKDSDMIAAEKAGIKKRFLVSSHYQKNSTILSNHVANLDEIIAQI